MYEGTTEAFARAYWHCPLRVLWAAHGTVGSCFDVLAAWRAAARDAGGRAVEHPTVERWWRVGEIEIGAPLLVLR